MGLPIESRKMPPNPATPELPLEAPSKFILIRPVGGGIQMLGESCWLGGVLELEGKRGIERCQSSQTSFY